MTSICRQIKQLKNYKLLSLVWGGLKFFTKQMGRYKVNLEQQIRQLNLDPLKKGSNATQNTDAWRSFVKFITKPIRKQKNYDVKQISPPVFTDGPVES